MKMEDAAPERNGLSFEFKKAAEQAVRDFPAATKGYLFIDGDDNAAVIVNNLLGTTSLAPELIASLLQKKSAQPFPGMAEALAFVNPSISGDNGAMYYGRTAPGKNPFGHGADKQASDAAVFDHELAHIVIKAAQEDEQAQQEQPNLVETVADAFANIRHYQRYGGSSTHLDASSPLNAIMFLSRATDTSHTTFWAVDWIRLDAKGGAFMALDPEKTARLAEEYARKFTPTRAEMDMMRRDFNDVIAAIRRDPRDVDPQILADAALRQQPGTISFHLGVRAMQYFFSTLSPDENAEWKDTREKLQQRIANLGEAGKIMADFLDNGQDLTAATQKPQAASVGSASYLAARIVNRVKGLLTR